VILAWKIFIDELKLLFNGTSSRGTQDFSRMLPAIIYNITIEPFNAWKQ
jgi:hypothetical protein